MQTKKILILGATGMLGHVLLYRLSENADYDVYATVRRSNDISRWFPPELRKKIRCNVDATDAESVADAVTSAQPDIVINCIGLIKQKPEASEPLSAIVVNSEFPHRLSRICRTVGARMIQISTDCVFDGTRGRYSENDRPDAADLYGRTKYLGEVSSPHCVTLRTSLIGHELAGRYGLIEWALSRQSKVRGYTHAIFSGFPTIELARIIDAYIVQAKELSGLYHVSSEPISKYELLKLVMAKYNQPIEIEPFDDFQSDKSLDSSLFRKATGYSPPRWTDLVDAMYRHFIASEYYRHDKI